MRQPLRRKTVLLQVREHFVDARLASGARVHQRQRLATVQRVHVRVPRTGQPDLAAADQVHALH